MNDVQHNYTQRTCIECIDGECRDFLNVILTVIVQNVVVLSVVAPSKKHLI